MDYAIWKPEHDGHAPPNWREGMKWTLEVLPLAYNAVCNPIWDAREVYHVEPEALNSPNDDVFAAPTPQKWFGQDSIDPIAATVAQLRQYPAEELAKHGITLAPERDWATELWADLFAIRGMSGLSKTVRDGLESDQDRAAIELLRTRVEQMIAERSKP